MKKYIEENKLNKEILENIANNIKSRKTIIFPTETVYGLGTNGLDESAIKKLYKIKNRPLNKPISLLVSDINMINKVTKNITDLEKRIINNFFPGPLTIILEKNDNVPDILTSNIDYVGIRMPQNDTALKLIKSVGLPLAVTSANISGEESGTNFEKIYNKLKKQVDIFIDGGNSKIGVPSTVIQVIDNNINIIREGYISKEDILNKIER